MKKVLTVTMDGIRYHASRPADCRHCFFWKTCATNRKTLRIAGDDKPAEVVRSRFMKLNADHIRFVLKCLAENSSPIRNMKQYLLASLYNAPTTMQLFYQNQTNHDLAMRR